MKVCTTQFSRKLAEALNNVLFSTWHVNCSLSSKTVNYFQWITRLLYSYSITHSIIQVKMYKNPIDMKSLSNICPNHIFVSSMRINLKANSNESDDTSFLLYGRSESLIEHWAFEQNVNHAVFQHVKLACITHKQNAHGTNYLSPKQQRH